MTQTLSPLPKQKFFDNNGAPLAKGLLFSYQAGTTTKFTTFSDSAGTNNSNPIILDYRGECNLWIPPNTSLKYVLAPANDTDPPTNPIWSVDNIVNSQLTTLYGGVDTGAVNAYILTFTAQFTSYTDGTIIYFLPSHTNTAGSTINVNGLGVVNILSQSGAALTAGMIVSGQYLGIIYTSGAFRLLNNPTAIVADGTAAAPSISFASTPNTGFFRETIGGIGISLNGVSIGSILTGSFTPNWFGFSVNPTGDLSYFTIGKLVMLYTAAGLQGTSNNTAMSITNIPSALRPTTGICPVVTVVDSGAFAVGIMQKSGLSTFDFYKGTAPPSATGFTAAGTKGLPPGWASFYTTA